MKTVAIFRADLLPISETFLQSQAAALEEFSPIFVGLRQIERSLPLSDSAIVVADQGMRATASLRTKIYRAAGFSPKFHKKVAAAGPSLVHAHFATDAVLALPLVSALEVPFIVTLHGYDVTMSDSHHSSTMAGRLFLRRRERLWRRATLFLCVSEFIRRKALEAGFPKEKLRVQYIGVDLRDFAHRGAQPSEEIVLFVGRLVQKKGCEYLLRAMQFVTQSRPTVKTVVIGDGPLRGDLEALALSLGIDCTFLGARPASSVREWLTLATVFCVPSVEAQSQDSEGLGMVFLEAQAMGVPVVSFRHGGIPEAVLHGVTGLLAEERNVAELQQHVERFLTDKKLQYETGLNGSMFVREYFDIKSRTRELERIYESICG
jgi:glycosyltransferase involved in cell wall biosynthesis